MTRRVDRTRDGDGRFADLDRLDVPARDHELLSERREHLRALHRRRLLGDEAHGFAVVLEHVVGCVVLVPHVAADAFVHERGFDRIRLGIDFLERGAREGERAVHVAGHVGLRRR